MGIKGPDILFLKRLLSILDHTDKSASLVNHQIVSIFHFIPEEFFQLFSNSTDTHMKVTVKGRTAEEYTQ